MRNLTIQRVMLITLFALLFSLATRVPVDTDTWWHIRSGEHTLTEGMIYEDPFSHSLRGEDWTNHSWGSQIVIFGVWEIAGNVGLALYTSILATVGMGFVYAAGNGTVYVRAFAVILGAATAAVFWSPRPQMLSFLLSTVFVWILYDYKRNKVDRLWWLPAIMLVWGNLHAGFSIGFIILGGFGLGEILNNLTGTKNPHVIGWQGIRKMVLVGVACIAVLVINPYGFAMLRVPFETVNIGVLRDFIQEWQSPNFQERQTWPFIFMLIALFGLLGTGARRIDWTDLVLISGTLFMALLYGRNISVFAVVATPVITFHATALTEQRGWLTRPIRRVTQRQARLNAGLVTVIVLGAAVSVLAVLDTELTDTAQRQFLPVDVAEFIEAEQPPQPMFNSYNWGGYLMWAVPTYPVYVDGRTDLYGDDFLNRYLTAAFGRPDWREILDEDGINTVVVETNSGLAFELAEEPGWTQIYPPAASEDTRAVIYVRDEPLNVASAD